MNEQQSGTGQEEGSFVCPVAVVDQWLPVLSAPLFRLALWYLRSGYTSAEHFLPRQERDRIAERLGIGLEWSRSLRQSAVLLGLLVEHRDAEGLVLGDYVNLGWRLGETGHRR